jgi:hypothetical protein
MRAHTSGCLTSFMTMREMQCAGVRFYNLQGTMWAMQCVPSSRKTYPCQLLYKRDLGNVDLLSEYRLYKIQSTYKTGWKKEGTQLVEGEATVALRQRHILLRVCHLSVFVRNRVYCIAVQMHLLFVSLYWFLDGLLFCLRNKSITCSKALIKISFSILTANRFSARYVMPNGREDHCALWKGKEVTEVRLQHAVRGDLTATLRHSRFYLFMVYLFVIYLFVALFVCGYLLICGYLFICLWFIYLSFISLWFLGLFICLRLIYLFIYLFTWDLFIIFGLVIYLYICDLMIYLFFIYYFWFIYLWFWWFICSWFIYLLFISMWFLYLLIFLRLIYLFIYLGFIYYLWLSYLFIYLWFIYLSFICHLFMVYLFVIYLFVVYSFVCGYLFICGLYNYLWLFIYLFVVY